HGGGFLVQDDALTLANCAVVGNVATVDDGGGVHVQAGGSLTVRGCTFSANSAGFGGAIDCYPAGGTLDVANRTPSGNSCNTDGGAIYFVGSGGSAAVRNSTIVNNTAQDSGGGILRGPNTTAFDIVSAIVSGNKALLGNGPDISSTLAMTVNFSAIGSAS